MAMLTEAEEERLAKLALDAIQNSGIATMTTEQRIAYLTTLGQASHQLLRSVAGDEFARGWLMSALDDLKKPGFLALRGLHS